VLNVLIGALAFGALSLFSQIVLSWFVVDPVTLSIAGRALLITLWSYVFVGNQQRARWRHAIDRHGRVACGHCDCRDLARPIAHRLPALSLDRITRRLDGYPAGSIAALIAQVLYYGLVWLRRPRPMKYANLRRGPLPSWATCNGLWGEVLRRTQIGIAIVGEIA